MELLKELGLETYPQYINGTKVMQVGTDSKVRTYTSDIPSLGSLWGLIELQLFIWKVHTFSLYLGSFFWLLIQKWFRFGSVTGRALNQTSAH